MAYATLAQLVQVGINADALADVPDADRQAALDVASAFVDSYLRARYTMPLVAWGGELTRATCIVAAYDLLTARGYAPSEGQDNVVRARYEDVLAWLRDVSAGEVTPDITDSAP